MKFRLDVLKMKCRPCDLIFLVEDKGLRHEKYMVCPVCRGEEVHSVKYMDDITIEEVEDDTIL